MKRLVVTLLVALGLAGPADADDAAAAAKLLKEAQAALSAATRPKARIAALGQAAQAQEAVLKALRGDLQALAARRDELSARKDEDEARLTAILSALQRLERSPRAATLAHPGGAVAAARAGMALASFIPALEVEAARIRVSLDELAALEARREVAASEARASLAALREARLEIAALLDRDRRTRSLPQALLNRIEAESAALARSGANLAALSTALPPSPVEARSGPSFLSTARSLPPPVQGRLVAAFGDAASPGVKFQAPAYAEVYAPWDGVIRFAGPFGDYGIVVILEPEDDALLIFAGLKSVRRDAGDVVLKGESLGALGGPAPETEEFLISTASALEALPVETLYMEVRQGGASVDPATWFALVTNER
ncbi:MAG: peptidoglycan DD-metalloendopeptidase family protein [Pseudomonadota bacterium]